MAFAILDPAIHNPVHDHAPEHIEQQDITPVDRATPEGLDFQKFPITNKRTHAETMRPEADMMLAAQELPR
jgi:hypothetical protein